VGGRLALLLLAGLLLLLVEALVVLWGLSRMASSKRGKAALRQVACAMRMLVASFVGNALFAGRLRATHLLLIAQLWLCLSAACVQAAGHAGWSHACTLYLHLILQARYHLCAVLICSGCRLQWGKLGGLLIDSKLLLLTYS
jgi:hypothetical protein